VFDLNWYFLEIIEGHSDAILKISAALHQLSASPNSLATFRLIFAFSQPPRNGIDGVNYHIQLVARYYEHWAALDKAVSSPGFACLTSATLLLDYKEVQNEKPPVPIDPGLAIPILRDMKTLQVIRSVDLALLENSALMLCSPCRTPTIWDESQGIWVDDTSRERGTLLSGEGASVYEEELANISLGY
jgi:hypothetical protein